MKKCMRCGQSLTDDVKFCFRCGSSQFTDETEAGPQDRQQSSSQQTAEQQPYGQDYAPSAYERPYQAYDSRRPSAVDSGEPATIGNYLLFELFMLIPIFNLVYWIIVAVGGPRYKKSMTNYARARFIIVFIAAVLAFIFIMVGGFMALRHYSPSSPFSPFSPYSSYGYKF